MDPSGSGSLQKTRLSERPQDTLESQQAQQQEQAQENGAQRTSSSSVFAETSGRSYGGGASNLSMMRSGRGAGGTSIAGGKMAMSASTMSSPRSNAASRYLVTVLPPSYLPHDPPHPRTSTLCSGYGPPAKFRRGTLVPLYPTLSGQLAAIAREYGLPSTGGLAVYLVELNEQGNPNTHVDNGLSDALVGGPRIGEEAWALLWGQLFAEEAAFSEDDDAASTDALRMAPGQLQRNDRDAQTPSEPMSDVSSSQGDSSSAIVNSQSADVSTTGPNISHFSSSSGASPYSNSTRFPKSSATSNTTVEAYDTSSPYFRPQSSASREKARSHRLGSSSRQPGMLHNKASRASLGTNRSYTQSVASQDINMAYGQAVIVGKLEFDIDRGRGGGKWFDSWLASAATETSGTTSSYPRGGTRHPESQLGSLLRSRMPSSEPASPVYSHNRRPISDKDRPDGLQVNGRGSPNSYISPKMAKLAESQSMRGAQSTSSHSLSPDIVRTSTAMSLTASRSSVASEQSIDRQSIASSSIGPVLMDNKRDSATFSSTSFQQELGERASTPSSQRGGSEIGTSSRHSRTASKASMESAGQSSTGMVGDAQEQGRAASRQSNRSSASAVSSHSKRGLSDAQFEMLNATPRVRPPHAFRQEQSSPTEPASHTDQRPPSPPPIDTHASVRTAPVPAEEVVDDQGVETEPQSAQPTFTEAASGPPRSRQDSQISARSGASSASFEAVSEDEGEEELDREDAYEALPDENDSHAPVADPAPQHAGIGALSSPSDKSQYGESAEQSEHAPSPDMAAALRKDPLKDMFGSDAVTWAELRASQASEPSAAADPALPHAQYALDRSEGPSPAAGLGILSPPAHHAAIPPSASSASFDPFEFDNEGRSPSPPRATELGGDADVEEITDLLKTFPVAKGPGLSSPINLGDSMPMSSSTTDDTLKSAGPENEFVAAIEERRPAVNHTRTASIASSSYSRRAHSRKSSSISSMRHSRNDSSASTSKKAPLSPIPSPTPVMVALPESDSNYSLASTAQSYPSISEPSSDFAAPIRGGNRAAGLPTDWATQLSAFPGLRSRANTDAAALPPKSAEDGADETVIHAVEVESAGESESLSKPNFSSNAFLTPNNARDSVGSLNEPDVSRSRSSSIEMMENLDDLEKALQELSPRSQKQPRQAVPMPDLRPLYPFDRSVSASPGYGSKSDLEAAAPSTPVVANGALGAETKTSDEKNPELSKDQPVVLSAPPRGASLPPATPEVASAPIEPSPPVPPLPLKIRPRETPLSPDAISVASTTLPYATQTTPLPTSPIQKVTFGNIQEATPPPPAEDRREVKFAPSPRVSLEEEQPTSARSVGSRFAGASLKLKNWGNKGKSDAREDAGMPQSAPVQLQSQGSSEPVRSPLGGFKGLSFWRQKESDDAQQNLAVETSLPMSPSNSQPGSNPTPTSASSGGRIPRKSSLASLKSAMLSRSESASPGPGPAPQIPLPSPANTAYSAFPSPPTHTSLASPTLRPDDFQSFMPSFPPPRPVGETAAPGTPPPLFRGDSSTTTTVESPQSQRAGIGLNSMSDLPAFSSIRARRDLDSTPEMRDLAGGRFLGYEGRGDGHTSSAPVTPAYAEPSVVSSSGRLGRPIKANPAKAQFRMSADADLTKMMSHMQAIEFGEDYTPLDSAIPGNKPSTATLAGLGLGMPKQ